MGYFGSHDDQKKKEKKVNVSRAVAIVGYLGSDRWRFDLASF